MADLVNELESISDYVQTVLTDVKVINYLPKTYKPKEVTIRFLSSDPVNESQFYYRLDHSIQIVYFDVNELGCISKMNHLERKFNDDLVIPLKGTNETRYLRIGSFSLSQPFESDSGMFACIGVLDVTIREPRTQPQYDKIGEIVTEITTDDETTTVKTNCHKE
ncbi:hypothetical protein MHI39_20185 [Heyndrickxia sp. FSL K6-6286]|uniref:hypothetical protein n=1 Tax=Heyndrickxia TaxID=2837504 RepID=UPI0015D1960D|nr:hypothetical protein [Heyndrickxia oleronia]MBU5211071.1 hypothetical protein [Heyndrickxia oleronia]NYV68913.1 hypothetical protein [Bacillus sp. Gen3]